MTAAILKIHQQAVTAINHGQYAEVDRLCDQIISRDKKFADAWFLKAMAAAGRMDVRSALPALIEAVKLSPANAEYLAQYAKLCALVNQDRKALEAADLAMAQKPDQALTLDTIGVVYTKLGAYEKAQRALQKAVDKAPTNAQFHFNLASAEQFLGREAQAEAQYQRAIELKPDFARAYWALSELKKNAPDAADVERLETLLAAKDISDGDELYLSHALSRAYEKQGRYADAFALLERGKFRYRAKLNYSWVVDERLFKAVHTAFPVVTQTNPVAESLGQEAIFVLGMPRSGTTLVERILSSHGSVESLGELQNFGLAVKQASSTDSRLVLDESVIQSTQTADMAEIGKRYLASLTNRNSDKPRFIDKMPLNFLYLGYIAEALPQAKIVLLRRNPLDTCVSNFRQLFAVSFSYYNYHYDLVDTAHYFRMFDQLMQKWLALYGDRIHVIDYEQLTADPEREVRKLLNYCGLEWDAQCLAFHENTSAVATASAMQVRQPMYQSSVGRWRRYEPQLAPVKAILEEAGIDYLGN